MIGLSIMSGAHLPICKKLMEAIQKEGINDIAVVVGGVIPNQDIPRLKKMGIRGVFPGGAHFDEIIQFIQEHVKAGS